MSIGLPFPLAQADTLSWGEGGIPLEAIVVPLLALGFTYWILWRHGRRQELARRGPLGRLLDAAPMARDIGRAVAYRGAEAWTSRTTVGTAQKLARLVQAGLATAWMKTLGDRTAPPRANLFTPSTIGMVG